MENIIFTMVLSFWLYGLMANSRMDLTEEIGCHDTEFRFGCESVTEKIAIFKAVFIAWKSDADFSPGKNFSGCEKRKIRSTDCKLCDDGHESWEKCIGHTDSGEEIDFRQSINRRCSGVNYCSFVFKQDSYLATGTGRGDVIIRYACVSDKHVMKTCNAKMDVVQEGIARTPGYPSYYIGETACHWELNAPRSQRVKVSFLDLSVRSIGPYESDCSDWVVVSENGLNLFKLCGDLTENVIIYSQGPQLNVSLVANSKTMYPKRGLMFHYKAVGCPAVRKPDDGYLVDRNDSFVHFRCCVGFVFPDTMSRDKILQCYNENTWDGQISDCVNLNKILEDRKNTLANETLQNLTTASSSKMETADTVKDIILPSIIILALFVGNAIVLYIIYRQRKKLAVQNERIEMKSVQEENADDEKY